MVLRPFWVLKRTGQFVIGAARRKRGIGKADGAQAQVMGFDGHDTPLG
jgi:hypothetical protein